MKRLRFVFFIGTLALTVLSSCAPASTPQSATPTVQGSASAAPSLVPINLAGPEMMVGSSWLYADGTLLVPVPAGIFTMGGGKTDNPVHQVNLPDFWIYRTKVTNRQYAYCVSQGGCTPPVAKDDPGFTDPLQVNQPVTGVDYGQAAAYCGFVHARLPTEAEWEKTARGPDANIYPWGNGAPTCDLLNYETCQGKTTPVNQYPRGQSYYKAFDMEGNAFEWAADWYKLDYYVSAPPDNPRGPEKGFVRSVRSSAFNSGTNQTQTYNRFFSGPADHRNNLGFRCVVEDPTYFAPYCNYPATYGTDGVGGGPSSDPTHQVAVDCGLLRIVQYPELCDTGQPQTAVTFTVDGPNHSHSPTPNSITVPSSCQLNNSNTILGSEFIAVYNCTAGGTVTLCGPCDVTLAGPPECPPGYAFDAGSEACIGAEQTAPAQCLPGLTVTPAPGGGQCCTYAPPNSSAPSDSNPVCQNIVDEQGFPHITCGPAQPSAPAFCPAGATFDGHECISYQTTFPNCKTTGIETCPPPKVCQPPGGGCPLNTAWDTNTCSCVCSGC